MEIVGVVPAAGYATRLQPLGGSKEVLPIKGKPVMDHLVERMRVGGATRVRVVTRAEKHDVIQHAGEIGAETVLGNPETVSDSILAGTAGLGDDDIVLIGFPDTLWEPGDGYVPLVRAVTAGCEVALGLFRIDPADLPRSDVVVFGPESSIAGIDIKPATPRSEWIWGIAAVRAATLAELGRAEWPGGFFDLLCREGRNVRGFPLSDAWLDIGTKNALLLAGGSGGSIERR
jgi:NDP-sugar pyrophosphorylase family protein